MQPIRTILLAVAAFTPAAAAQEYLFTVSQPEVTLSGSGGTVLRFVQPNEIAHLRVQPCPSTAEKWAPRTMFHTQAGDEDNDNTYWEPTMMGSIDALLLPWMTTTTPVPNQRDVYYSVSQAVGTTVSGAPGLRPGDIGRIRRIGAADGQIEYFIREEQIKQALGLPLAAVVDVDAAAAQPNFGVFFSIATDTVCNLCVSGPTLVRDGDLLLIPAPNLAWSGTGTVASVMAGRAVVVHSEAQLDLMVQNARVTNRFGVCQTQILDLTALDLDQNGAVAGFVPVCGGAAAYPFFTFAGESLTGGAILSTMGGGQIVNTGCMPYGTSCFAGGPTFGNQIGLRPTSVTTGIPSHVNGLCQARVFRCVSEAVAHQIPMFSPAVIDFASPGALTWVFLTFAPAGPGVVAPSTAFVWGGGLCYPDYYAPPFSMGTISTATGFGTYTSPAIPFACDLIFSGVTITPWSTLEISTPTTVEVF